MVDAHELATGMAALGLSDSEEGEGVGVWERRLKVVEDTLAEIRDRLED